MKAPPIASENEGSASLASPAIIVILVLMLGATIYLFRKGYMRRRTGYITAAILVAALIGTGIWMYTSGA